MRHQVLLQQKSNVTSSWKTAKSIYLKITNNSKVFPEPGNKEPTRSFPNSLPLTDEDTLGHSTELVPTMPF